MYEQQRKRMVDHQIAERGVTSSRVLEAMRKVPRHLFVPEGARSSAYADKPLPIGHGQTISQPYIVALMSSLCNLRGTERVLEIGTGCGYQTAVLRELSSEVYTIEIYKELSGKAQQVLYSLGYEDIHFIVGNGYTGHPDAAPYDAILLTASPEQIPHTLLDQLADGGVLVGPEGRFSQDLMKIEKEFGKLNKERICAVAFVPMVDKKMGG
jgi:protein-L-isoaspartate(D-aspartate) O-methyltransferase